MSSSEQADSDVHEQELADQLGAVNINGGVSVGGGNDDQEGAIDLQGADEQQQAYAPPQGWQQVDMMQMMGYPPQQMRPRFQQVRSQYPPPNYICKICGTPGHWIQRCPQSSDPTKTSTTPPPTYVCRACNIPGHWIQQCPARMTTNNEGGLQTQRNNNNNGAGASPGWRMPRPVHTGYAPRPYSNLPYGAGYISAMPYGQPVPGYAPAYATVPGGAPVWNGQAGPAAYALGGPDGSNPQGYHTIYAASPPQHVGRPIFNYDQLGMVPLSAPSAAPGGDDGATTLWMGDLQPWMTDKYLANLFSQVSGDKVTAKVHVDKQGRNTSYGFIKFSSAAAASNTINSLNGKVIPGTNRLFRLNWAQRRSAGPGEDQSSSSGALAAAGGPPPPSSSSSSNSASYAAIALASGAEQNFFEEDTPLGEMADDHTVVYTIFVGNLAPEVDQNTLVGLFTTRYASVRGGRVVVNPTTHNSKGFGFVTFDNRDDARRAMTEMQGQVCGDRPIRISPAKRRTDNLSILTGGNSTGSTVGGGSAAIDDDNDDDNNHNVA